MTVKEVWEKLGEVTIDEEECIRQPFLDFPIGTHREKIWHWIEEEYNVSIVNLLCRRAK